MDYSTLCQCDGQYVKKHYEQKGRPAQLLIPSLLSQHNFDIFLKDDSKNDCWRLVVSAYNDMEVSKFKIEPDDFGGYKLVYYGPKLRRGTIIRPGPVGLVARVPEPPPPEIFWSMFKPTARFKYHRVMAGPVRFVNSRCRSYNCRYDYTYSFGGKVAIHLEALSEITSGSEVTVFYGDEYFDSCRCCDCEVERLLAPLQAVEIGSMAANNLNKTQPEKLDDAMYSVQTSSSSDVQQQPGIIHDYTTARNWRGVESSYERELSYYRKRRRSSSDDSEGTVPDDNEGTVPDDSEGTVPDDNEGTVPDDSGGTVSDDNEGTVPDDSEGTVSDDSEGTVPDDSEGTVPDTEVKINLLSPETGTDGAEANYEDTECDMSPIGSLQTAGSLNQSVLSYTDFAENIPPCYVSTPVRAAHDDTPCEVKIVISYVLIAKIYEFTHKIIITCTITV